MHLVKGRLVFILGEPVEGVDFDYIRAKMPRHDKEGNDVTGDKYGPGGRRKESGQQSAQA